MKHISRLVMCGLLLAMLSGCQPHALSELNQEEKLILLSYHLIESVDVPIPVNDDDTITLVLNGQTISIPREALSSAEKLLAVESLKGFNDKMAIQENMKPASKDNKPVEEMKEDVDETDKVSSEKSQVAKTENSRTKDDIRYTYKVEYESMPFERVTRETTSLNSGQTNVVQTGINGTYGYKYEEIYINGVYQSRKMIDSWVEKQPQNEVVEIGTAYAGDYDRDAALKMFNLVNAERSRKGKAKLTWSDSLYQSAHTRAREITVVFDHIRPNGEFVLDMASDVYGENIVFGSNDMEYLVKLWKDSPTHYENMLEDFGSTAIAVYHEGGYTYAVQLFCW